MFYDKDLEVLETLSTCTEGMPGKQSLTLFPNTELKGTLKFLSNDFEINGSQFFIYIELTWEMFD